MTFTRWVYKFVVCLTWYIDFVSYKCWMFGAFWLAEGWGGDAAVLGEFGQKWGWRYVHALAAQTILSSSDSRKKKGAELLSERPMNLSAAAPTLPLVKAPSFILACWFLSKHSSSQTAAASSEETSLRPKHVRARAAGMLMQLLIRIQDLSGSERLCPDLLPGPPASSLQAEASTLLLLLWAVNKTWRTTKT